MGGSVGKVKSYQGRKMYKKKGEKWSKIPPIRLEKNREKQEISGERKGYIRGRESDDL